jgi:hypothetical protein
VSITDTEQLSSIFQENWSIFMINYTLKQLYSFEAVVRLKSFTKASKELYITQPAVYMQIQQLTQNIGAKLQ